MARKASSSSHAPASRRRLTTRGVAQSTSSPARRPHTTASSKPAPVHAARPQAPRRRTVVVPPRGSWSRTKRNPKRAARLGQPHALQPPLPLSGAGTPPAWPAPSGSPAPSSAVAQLSAGSSGQPLAHQEPFHIPTGYGDHRVVLMVKDPWWLYAYWEIQPHRERQVRAQLAPEEVAGLQTVLRVYDVTDRRFPDQPAHRFMDHPLSGLANNWYIHVDAPNCEFIVEIGLLTRQGRFLLLVRSNQVRTPRFGPSEVIDEEWMIADELYWKLFGMTAGLGGSSGPLGAKELLERARSSPGLFSPGFLSVGQSQLTRGFWLTVHTDVVVHGTTTPKSTVTIEGQPVRVRPDGTFSLRMTLEDGAHTVPVEATSPDGRHTQQIAPVVSRTLAEERTPITPGRRTQGARPKEKRA